MTVLLRYDPTFSKPNTCFLLSDGRTLRCRIREPETVEIVVDHPLKFRVQAPGGLYLRPCTALRDEWSLEDAVVTPSTPRVAIRITHVPEWVAHQFQEL